MEHQNTQANFPQTRWSLVVGSRDSGENREEAVSELCQAYWAPLYAFCRKSGKSASDAEDLVQGFLAKVVADDLFSRADDGKGKMRTFLLTLFRRFQKDERNKAYALKRGGGQVFALDINEVEDWYEANVPDEYSAEVLFDKSWARTVLENAMLRLNRQMSCETKDQEFLLLRPFLTGSGDLSKYESIGEKLGISAGNVRVRLHRMRSRFALALREEVRDTLPEGADIDEEIRYLIELV